jgi:uncharacterized membrane protein
LQGQYDEEERQSAEDADRVAQLRVRPAGRAFLGVGMAVAIGAGLGLIFGMMTGNVVFGPSIGAGLGVVVGAIIEMNRDRG